MLRTTAGSTSVRSRRASDESGVALVMVVGTILVLAMFAMAALAYTMRSEKFARYDQDYSAAMAAAQSGVDDYVSRLNRLQTYGSTVDCSNLALRGPTTVANTCGWNPTTPPGWLPVNPGETGPRAAYFHYSVDASKAQTQGTILLSVTGRVNDVFRTIDVAVGKGGSTDYVYYTDFESADPSNVQAYPSTPSAACGGSGYALAKYFYNGRSGAGCTEITFISGDVLDGSVFSNDAILSNGAQFKEPVQTAYPTCDTATSVPSTWRRCLRTGSDSSNVTDFTGDQPKRAEPKYLDDTSAGFATHPGCHYYGATRIIFRADGKMTVWNKKVNNGSVPPLAIAEPLGPTPVCGTLDDLDSAAGAVVDVPNEMVVYVGTSSVSPRQCFAGQIGGESGRTLPLGTYDSSKVAAPTGSGQSYTVDTNMRETTKFCHEGNLYVEGVVKGRTTISSAQSIVVTGDLVLAGGLTETSTDMLGLVATNSVEVFHPRVATVSSTKVNSWCSGSGCAWKWGNPASEQEIAAWPKRYTDPTTGAVEPASGIQIAGSIQTLQHSFLVQKYAVGGDQGKLLVNGSIAQRWRGIVGQGSNGYKKDYRYDGRLKYSSPPYFPKWADSQWSLRYSGEVNTLDAVRNSSL